MLFCSPVFMFFFVAYWIVWCLVPKTWQLWVIIFGSLIFYGYWNWNYVLIPVVLTFLSYVGGLWVSNTQRPESRRLKLMFCIIILATPLFVFKYANFFAGKEIIFFELPLGISFITFTLIAYLVDVSGRTYPVEPSIAWLMGYVTFFPQLIAGPILRPSELLPQLKEIGSVSLKVRYQAMTIFTVGLAKKLVFADQLQPYVDQAFLTTGNGIDLLIGLYLYPVQLYCDFSGYSDMAIGLALFYGVELPLNFDRPYIAASVNDLWRRWHMTLTSWLKDYVYIPLVRRSNLVSWKLVSIFFTMVLCGFWHGAAWTYIIWGGMNGIFLCIGSIFKIAHFSFRLPKIVKILITFHTFAVSAIFVRAHNVANAFDMFGCIQSWRNIELINVITLAYPIVLMLVFYVMHPLDNIHLIKKSTEKLNPWLLATLLVIAWLMAITLSAGSGGSRKFVYFDF